MQLFEILACFVGFVGKLFGTDRCKKSASEKKCEIVRKRGMRLKRPGILWVLKTREQTAPDLRRSEKARGVDRTRFSCLKARWRIYLCGVIAINQTNQNAASILSSPQAVSNPSRQHHFLFMVFSNLPKSV